MIHVVVKPRADNRFDIYVSDEGDEFVNSNQGYENVEDAERIARRLFSRRQVSNAAGSGFSLEYEPATLTVEYRDGRVKSGQLR